MDDQRFDRLVRTFAQPRTRRWTLGALAASLGIATRAKPAKAIFCFSGQECCGPGCQTPANDPTIPGTCYNRLRAFASTRPVGLSAPSATSSASSKVDGSVSRQVRSAAPPGSIVPVTAVVRMRAASVGPMGRIAAGEGARRDGISATIDYVAGLTHPV